VNISFPTDTRELINSIRGVVGRAVYFYTDNPTECSVCSLDPITNTSTNPYCTTCSGLHYIHNYSSTTISGHITWNPAETLQWSAGGQYELGDVRVQVEYTVSNLSTIDNTEYIMVDGKRVIIRNKIYRGVPELNRVLLNCSLEE
jgi:hypothetical protein